MEGSPAALSPIVLLAGSVAMAAGPIVGGGIIPGVGAAVSPGAPGR